MEQVIRSVIKTTVASSWHFISTVLSEQFLILRRTQRDITINVHWSSCKAPVIMVKVLIKLQFSQQIFEKYSNIKSHENPSSGSRVVLGGQTEGQTDMTNLIVALSNFANATKMKRPTLKIIMLHLIRLRSTNSSLL